MPDELSLYLRDLEVIIIHLPNDFGRPLLGKFVEFIVKVDGLIIHCFLTLEGMITAEDGGSNGQSLFIHYVTASATMFFQQTDILDMHGFLGRFCHVIHRQRRDRNRRQGFHLHARLAHRLGCSSDHYARDGIRRGRDPHPLW